MRRYSLAAAAVLALTLLFAIFGIDDWGHLFQTPDQKGYRLYQKGKFLAAAKAFDDSEFKGVAYFKAGEFKKAEQLLQGGTSRRARFNYANALFMQGKYEKAIAAYDLVLKIDPNFTQAAQNRVLTEARLQAIRKHRDNDEGTGGQLAADEIRFDNQNNRGQEVTEQKQKGVTPIGEARWLDRLQTSPSGFLKNKFSYQHQMKEAEDAH